MTTVFEQICLKNKYGYCKFGKTCRSKHNNQECEKNDCGKWNCDKRHPRDCWWFNKFQRCRFSNCSYKHEIKSDNSMEKLDEIGKQIKTCEKQIAEKENELLAQENRIKQLESDMKVAKLEEKIVSLEKFVLCLEEKVEMLELDKYNYPTKTEAETPDYSSMALLVRRESFDAKCELCDYTGRNVARLRSHIAVHHTKYCLECDPDKREHLTEADFEKHNDLVHINKDKELTEEEVDKLSEKEAWDIEFGPETPRRKSFRKANLKLKKYTNLL